MDMLSSVMDTHDRAGTVEGMRICETRIKSYGGEPTVIPDRDADKNAIVVATSGDRS